METLQVLLQRLFHDAIVKTFGQDGSSGPSAVEIVPCSQENFGHYQCNDPLKLARVLKKKPREVAAQIMEHLADKDEEGRSLFSQIEVAGPGFINISFAPSFLSLQLDEALRDPHLGGKLEEKKQKIIVDFSSPNIAKELHVGHLRSTIIGDCIARLFEFLGHEVLRFNHVGDWGTQFGMLIAYIKRYVPEMFAEKREVDLTDLMDWYKASKKLFDGDEEFKRAAQLQVVKLQRNEKESIFAWQKICEVSRKAFQQIYDLLDIRIVERGESFYHPYLKKIVDDLEKKGLITLSEGAKCVFVEGFYNREGKSLPVMVQKSDGSYNYDTTDLAAFYQRCQEEKADRIIIVTDAGQSLHFQMVYQVAVKAGYLDPIKVHFDHVSFGLVLGPDGKKFKTREGETEKLIDLLVQAIAYAKKILIERLSSADETELDQLACVLGMDAVKYADLHCHRQKDYLFSYEKMLCFEGNTAAFLLYAYVRIMGIKRKTQISSEEILERGHINLDHPSEIALGVHLRRFPEVLSQVTRDLFPHRLCDYLYELAEKFHAFFRDCRVEGSEKEMERLALCELTAKILEQGLSILGLKTLPRM